MPFNLCGRFAIGTVRALSRRMTPDDVKGALWLEVLSESGICAARVTTPWWKEADELTRILVRSRETAITSRESSNRSQSKNHQKTITSQSTIKDQESIMLTE
jgi:hypothetical protein